MRIKHTLVFLILLQRQMCKANAAQYSERDLETMIILATDDRSRYMACHYSETGALPVRHSTSIPRAHIGFPICTFFLTYQFSFIFFPDNFKQYMLIIEDFIK